MASVNKVILIGNLGSDPEIKFLPSGQAVANFNIATTEKWTGKDGNPGEKTEWHRIVVFGKQAENCQRYLQKGRAVYVRGGFRIVSGRIKRERKRRRRGILDKKVSLLGGVA